MFQDYSIDDYKKACYIILRPDLTPEYFIRHFGMSRYEYSICQQRLKELQKFYGIEYHLKKTGSIGPSPMRNSFSSTIRECGPSTIATAETLQTGANWSEGFILPERFFLPMTIRIWMLCQKQWVFPAAICAMQSNFAAPFCKVITSGWKTRPITECTLWATNGTSGAV